MKRLAIVLAMMAACGEPVREDHDRVNADVGTPGDEACVNFAAGLDAIDHPEAFDVYPWRNPPDPDWWEQMSRDVGSFTVQYCEVGSGPCTGDELSVINRVSSCFEDVGGRPRGMIGIDGWRESVFECFKPLDRDTRQVSRCCRDSLLFVGFDRAACEAQEASQP